VDVKDKNVVDVGAYVGDSAIYFALRGARKVIAIEPHPGAYEEMSENIRLNNLENIIEPINAGLASKPGRVCVEDVDVQSTATTYHRPGQCDSEAPVITLSDIIDNYNIDDNTLLKMDCQGCEYDVILNDYERIKAFKEIIFEYHEDIAGKPYQELLKKLSNDYNCVLVKKNKNYGTIYCITKR
jgi:FkbM family methyltransferase